MSLLTGAVKTYHEIVVAELTPKEDAHTNTHDVYYCPFCEEKTGEPDTKGKFYFDRVKEIAWCFRCHAVGMLKVDFNLDVSEGELRRALLQYRETFTSYDRLLTEGLNFEGMFDTLNDSCIEYLAERNPFIPALSEMLGIRSYGTGVVFPFSLRRKVLKYQVRFFNNPEMKYYTSLGVKIPYSPRGVFDTFKLYDEQKITIVEGVFDAIAAMCMGFPNPVAILGSSITPYTIHILRKLVPEEVYILMDETSISYDILRSIRRQMPSVTKFEVIKSWGDDPEEIMMKTMSNSDESIQTFLDNVQGIIKTYELKRDAIAGSAGQS